MRNSVWIGVIAAMAVSTASIASECGHGSDSLLQVDDWSIEAVDQANNRLTVSLLSTAEQPIRMIDASVGFYDALGGPIASYALDRDAAIDPGDVFTESRVWGPHTFERLLDLRPEDATAVVCVRSVLYSDGTRGDF